MKESVYSIKISDKNLYQNQLYWPSMRTQTMNNLFVLSVYREHFLNLKSKKTKMNHSKIKTNMYGGRRRGKKSAEFSAVFTFKKAFTLKTVSGVTAQCFFSDSLTVKCGSLEEETLSVLSFWHTGLCKAYRRGRAWRVCVWGVRSLQRHYSPVS